MTLTRPFRTIFWTPSRARPGVKKQKERSREVFAGYERFSVGSCRTSKAQQTSRQSFIFQGSRAVSISGDILGNCDQVRSRGACLVEASFTIRSRRHASTGASFAGNHSRSRFACGRRSEEHTSELQSPDHLVCRLLLEKKNTLISLPLRFTHAHR